MRSRPGSARRSHAPREPACQSHIRAYRAILTQTYIYLLLEGFDRSKIVLLIDICIMTVVQFFAMAIAIPDDHDITYIRDSLERRAGEPLHLPTTMNLKQLWPECSLNDVVINV